MKKLIFFACAASVMLFNSTNVKGQNAAWDPTPPNGPGDLVTNPQTNNVIIDGTSKLGINTTSPTQALTINGNIDFTNIGTTYRHIRAQSGLSGLALLANSGWDNGAGIVMNGGSGGDVVFVSPKNGTPGSYDNAFSFKTADAQNNGTWNRSLMTIYKNGKITIGEGLIPNGPGVPNLEKLTVGGSLALWEPDDATYRTIKGFANWSGLALLANSGWDNGAGMVMNGGSGGDVVFVSPRNGTPGSYDNAFSFKTADAQNNGTWNRSLMTIYKNGKITIGEGLIPNGPGVPNLEKLTVGGSLALWEPNAQTYRTIKGFAHLSGLAIFANSEWGNGAGIMLNGVGANGGSDGDISIVAGNGSGSGLINFARWNGSGWTSNMVIDKDGKVCIGGAVPNTLGYPNYKLFVAGGILTERVKVAISGSADWSDYVFADDYNLKPLSEVECFIGENKHLPDVPSAEEVVKTGIDMAQMDAKLLQKIEELTLYVIQQQKEIEALKKELKK